MSAGFFYSDTAKLAGDQEHARNTVIERTTINVLYQIC